MQRIAAVLACGIVLAVGLFGSVYAKPFYSGKNVTFLVGSGVGAGYDSFARATARHLKLPGNPTIIVQNMPGAGGLIEANYLYNISAKDGTVIGLVNRYTVVQAIIGNKNAHYDPMKFNWLGTPAAYDDDPYVFVVRSDQPLTTVEALRNANEPLVIGTTGSAIAYILKPALGMNVKVISYKKKSEVDIALARGEVYGMGIAYANLRKRHPNWVKTNFVIPVVQFTRRRSDVLPNVPASGDLTNTPEDRALLKFIEIPLAMAYPFVLPPGVTSDRIEVVNKAFEELFNDPAYRKDILKQGLAYSPKSGKEVRALVEELSASPKSAIAQYREIVGIRGGE